MVKAYVETLAVKNQLNKIVVNMPSFEVSGKLNVRRTVNPCDVELAHVTANVLTCQTNILSLAKKVLGLTRLSAYKGDVPTKHVAVSQLLSENYTS
jgi:hypothetical protein